MCPKIALCMANSVDPDQIYAASDLGLQCLQRPILSQGYYHNLLYGLPSDKNVLNQVHLEG